MYKFTKIIKYCFLLACLFFAYGCKKTGTKAHLYETCVDTVRSRLKAPATAIFSSMSESYINQKIKTYPNDGVLRASWTVSGVVDSQNSFGALIRSDFSCTFKQWKKEIKLEKVNI
ncbi:hypothetical protein RS130_11605 [Paraglaciecola aquimarina]|uniref:Lipoprotein n=1 Tax=Paraglaciecola aquimarina TaxID=1235557 RepID=A0ABU3SWU9_9ALTE|nr:hypothetical protein [Paraglaciecola aquimarina]MDU0354495.1 hypothetical protein [Paraglaciecola aquimarina]